MSEDSAEAIVYVVDDDEPVRYGLRMLFESSGHSVTEFASAEAFLAAYSPETPGCLILDIHMPTTSGLELQEMLAERGMALPIIFLTGHGDVPAAVKALKSGAIDFFQKPIADEQLLLDRVTEALRQDTLLRRQADERTRTAELVARLTPRETEVMDLVCEGRANKVIAIDLGISERTVELHRAHLMKKLEARSVPDLIRIKDILGK